MTEAPTSDTTKTFRQIIDLWPKRSALASALAAATGKPVAGMVVRNWYSRDNIPEAWWNTIVKVAKKQGFPLTYAELAGVKRATDAREATAEVEEVL